MTSSDFSYSIPPDFALVLIPEVTEDVSLRLYEISLVPPSAFPTFRSPYAGESFEAAFQNLRLFLGLHHS